MAKCGDCVHYNRCAGNAGWCKKDAIHVAVIADKEACEDFKGGTSMPDKTSEVVTVPLPWYEALIATYAKLEVVRQLVRHMSKTYNKELDLLKAVLLEEECETT
jgi:hypothetical protein